MSTIQINEGDPSANGGEYILSRRGFITALALVGISLAGCKPVQPVRTTGGGHEGNTPPPSDTINETGFVVDTSGGINELGNTPPPNGFTGGSANEGNNPPL